MSSASLDEAFRRLAAGDVAGALALASALAAREPANARAQLALGIAIAAQGRIDAAYPALQRAAQLAPKDYAPWFELGRLHESAGRPQRALEAYERAAALRPQFAAAHFAAGLVRYAAADWSGAAQRFESVLRIDPRRADARVNLAQSWAELGQADRALALLEEAIAIVPEDAPARYAAGWLLDRLGRHDEAIGRYQEALARDPRHLESLRALGRHRAAAGAFDEAAGLFASAARLAPHDADLPLYAAQSLLLLARWDEAWPHYARRDSRIAFEAARAAIGKPYAVPTREALRGADVALVGEQGLGDVLFFLRYAPAVRSLAARLTFVGNPRLHRILARTGAFDDASDAVGESQLPILVGDLPLLLESNAGLFAPSLRAPPEGTRVEAVRRELEAAGPRPWIAVTWRSGTPHDPSRQALSKELPVAELFHALPPLGGTVFAFQRSPRPGELAAASSALGAPVRDLSHRSDDLEDVLAVVSLADRHIGVSSTNMHLADLAGCSADVLLPWPAEWRWRLAGASPWFPGFPVHRQERGGDWSRALARLVR